MVAHLRSSSAENYNGAWELLTKRFENKRKIFSDHLNRLIDLPILDNDSAKQTKWFIDSINESIHLIKTKEDVEVIFAHNIIRKFNKALI